MRNKYEAMIIFYPNRDEDREKLMERIKSVILSDGEISSIDDWGMRKLAYEINYTNEGYYTLMNFETTPEQIAEMGRVLKITDCVMRQMILREDE